MRRSRLGVRGGRGQWQIYAGSNQEDLRDHNLSVTLDTLLRAQKPMSRADLAKETGLTKATLSLLASMLIESGVVQEGEPVVSTTYGRPSTPLEIRGGSIAGIGLQINTDGYGCLALDLNGDTLGREWVSEDMTGTDPYEIFAKLDAMTFPLESRLKRRGCKVVGAGFALPGIVTDDMWLLVARNLGWENVNLTRFNVVRRLDVVAGNEAKMAAIAQIPGYATERAPFLNVVDRTDSFIYLLYRYRHRRRGGARRRSGDGLARIRRRDRPSVRGDGWAVVQGSRGRHGCLERLRAVALWSRLPALPRMGMPPAARPSICSSSVGEPGIRMWPKWSIRPPMPSSFPPSLPP